MHPPGGTSTIGALDREIDMASLHPAIGFILVLLIVGLFIELDEKESE